MARKTYNFFGDSMTGATFSPCRTWRYALWRRWSDSRDPIFKGPDHSRMVAFIGLNPSTADETKNDPTITRCIDFAKSWGFDGLCMLNLFAYRATDPDVMKRAADPVGPENDECLTQAMHLFGKVICAWGVDGAYRNRVEQIRDIVSVEQQPMFHLGLTKGGQPRHPLYLKKGLQPIPWEVPAYSGT